VLDYLHARWNSSTEVARPAADGDPLHPHRTLRGERVAIIDDEDAMTSVTSALLQRLGYATTSYNSAARFLKAFEAAPEKTDLAIVDVVMPQMSGVQLVSALRGGGYQVPILLMTGFSVKSRLEQAGASGRIAFVRKPFSTIHLAQSVRRLLSSAN
jgi:FixJ family two-component response regulator